MKQPRPTILRQTFSILLIILGSLALSFFYLTSHAHSLLFDTNYYLTIVTPLPKNTDVAQAMSTYTISTLFENANVEEKIQNALPEQIKFLASTLTTDLQNRSYQRTKQLIQSDQFSSLWIAANTLFHDSVLTIVRGGGILSQINETQPLQDTSVQFDGSQLAQTIKERLGSDSQLFTDEQFQQFKNITIPAYTKLQNIRQIVYWNMQLASILFPLAIALLLFGIAIAFSRQKAFLIAGIVIIVAMITTLTTIQVFKNDALSQITQPEYNAAAGTVLNSFLHPLIQTLRLTILGSLIIIVIALLSGQYTWAVNFRKSLGISQFQKSTFMQKFTRIRFFLARYSLWLYLLGTVIAIITLFVIENLMFAQVIIVLSYLLIYFAVLTILFPRIKVSKP